MSQKAGKKPEKTKATGLTLSVKKSENFAQWYPEVLTKSELISYYEDVSGCYILRPWAFSIWEKIQTFFDKEIKKSGVEPCYFPMFVSKKALETEKAHVEGFAAEVAWVTRSGNTELEAPIALRPTSETIMYPYFAKWVRSHRDLPLRLNQWTNVVRWEFKNPTPFIRTREFLWQEGHSAFASQAEADCEVIEILDLYARVYEQLLAVPVIKGRKSDKEKFAGGDYTTTVEAFIPEPGRAVQAATSHSLGQNFSKMFGISFTSGAVEKEESETKGVEKSEFAYQNSWGLSTRTLGVLVMIHGDDKGLVLPPRVAPIQIILIPIIASKTDPTVAEKITEVIQNLCSLLSAHDLRAKADLRSDKNPGWKYNYWEQKGVPLRIEVGENELKNNELCFVRRDNGAKRQVSHSFKTDTASSSEKSSKFINEIQAELEDIQSSMLQKARKTRDERISIVFNFQDFVKEIGKGNMVLAPWSLTTESEDFVKEETQKIFAQKKTKVESTQNGEKEKEKEQKEEEEEKRQLTGAAKSLCIPFNQPEMPKDTMCFTGCGLEAKEWCLWGRSY